MAVSLGRLGFWTGQPGLTGLTDEQIGEFAGQLEQAGYGAIWLGSASADLRFAEPILSATSGLVYATGILNVWVEPAEQVVASYRRLSAYPDRVLAGIGVGHPERPDNKQYAKPYASLVAYLDALAEIPAEHLALAALGPKVLALAAKRTAGAHPYSTTPEHTRQAREILGAGPLLVPEQKVVLETDPARARQIGRQKLGLYLGLVNYRNNFLRLGFTEEDLAEGGSDRLVDATIAWGDPAAVAARISEHHRAGADQVAVQVLGADNPLPIAELREISDALAG
jgi:probable F420-dependent oxidoreductase